MIKICGPQLPLRKKVILNDWVSSRHLEALPIPLLSPPAKVVTPSTRFPNLISCATNNVFTCYTAISSSNLSIQGPRTDSNHLCTEKTGDLQHMFAKMNDTRIAFITIYACAKEDKSCKAALHLQSSGKGGNSGKSFGPPLLLSKTLQKRPQNHSFYSILVLLMDQWLLTNLSCVTSIMTR